MKKFNLLYVEDDLEALEDTKFLLREFFSTIHTATDGKEALEIYNLLKLDVLILDINIPKINGIDLALKIRELNRDIPILFLTAYSDKDMLLKAVNMQATGYLIKPYKFEELKKAILKIENSFAKKEFFILKGEYSWHIETKKLLLKDKNISLTKKEKALIELLLTNSSKFFTSTELAIELFEKELLTSKDNNIVQLISRFKSKILKSYAGSEFFIENVYGMGYRISLKISS